MARLGRSLIAGGLTVGIAVGIGLPTGAGAAPSSAVPTTVALWLMDEPVRAVTAVDSSGNGLHGSVGADVQTGARDGDVVGYRLQGARTASREAQPERLVTVPHSPRLNPDAAGFSVTVRFRTTRSAGNLVQKGQSRTAGGFWKVEQSKGRVRCAFRGDDGGQAASATLRTDDGRWHTVRCDRTAESVTLSVDGVPLSQVDGRSGTIANDWELAMGGKSRCRSAEVNCDYFSGDIDFVRLEKHEPPTVRSEQRAPSLLDVARKLIHTVAAWLL